MLLQSRNRLVVGRHAFLQHHVGLHDLTASFVGHTDHCALGDVGVAQQRGLHFRPGDVVARGDDHVVATRCEVEVASFVLCERVAGEVPAVAHVRPLARVAQIAAPGRAANGEQADGAAWHLMHAVVDDLRFVAGHWGAGARGL